MHSAVRCAQCTRYYSDGGLYDQRHELALLPGAAGPTEEGKPAGEKQEKPANAMPGARRGWGEGVG